VSKRKNVIIAVSIVVLCMLLITQIIGDHSPRPSAREVALQLSDSGARDTEDLPEEQVQLNAIVRMSDKQFQELEELNSLYNEKQSAVRVTLTNYTKNNAYSYLKEHARIGDNPDILLLDYTWVNEFAAAGYLSHQLESHIKVKNSNLDQLLHWNNYVWAEPYYSDPYVAVLNERAILNNEMEALPSSLNEWIDYQAARSSKEDNIPGGIVYAQQDDPLAFISLVWMLGEKWEQADNGMYVIAGESDSLMDLLFGKKEVDGETDSGSALLFTESLSDEEKWNRFDEGLLPILIMKLSELEQERPNLKDYAYALVRTDGERKGGWVAGSGFAVSSTSTYPEEAFKWINAMDENNRRADPSEVVGQSFQSDPELLLKLDVIKAQLVGLYNGSIEAVSWNAAITDRWAELGR
jgi:ABC-type glycerol-3-phosphate transport system substrate-binding protein